MNHLVHHTLLKIVFSRLQWRSHKVVSLIVDHQTNQLPLFQSMNFISTHNRNQTETELKEDQTFFGNEVVSLEEKQQRVNEVFKSVASNYDLMNDLMSVGIHRCMKDRFIQILSPTPGTKLLDVAGGTGDIAFRFLKVAAEDEAVLTEETIPNVFNADEEETRTDTSNRSHVVVLDINENMLKICKEKANNLGFNQDITCVHGSAEALPFPDNTFDAYTIAFGIRNVPDIDQALDEAFRVLKPGGRFLCLEFSEVKNPALSRLYDLYSFQVIPCLGQIVARDWKSYQYLVESIRKFPNQEDFRDRIEDAGFSLITYENFLGGIFAIHSGFKV